MYLTESLITYIEVKNVKGGKKQGATEICEGCPNDQGGKAHLTYPMLVLLDSREKGGGLTSRPWMNRYNMRKEGEVKKWSCWSHKGEREDGGNEGYGAKEIKSICILQLQQWGADQQTMGGVPPTYLRGSDPLDVWDS